MGIGSMMTALFVCGLIFSIFSTNLAMGTGHIELSRLLSPALVPDNVPPEPQPPARQDKATSSTVSELPNRPVNQLRTDETPTKGPTTVSTVANKHRSRPSSPFTVDPENVATDGTGPAIGKPGPVKTGGGTAFAVNPKPIANDKGPAKRIKPKVTPPPKLKKQPDIVKSIGVVNGKAIRLVKPVVTPTIRMVGAKGAVKVNVLINKQGKVVSANAVSGHRLLRPLAVKAALRSTFTPTKLNLNPIKVTGVIIYNFK